ncbi:MAG TPA: hypothetical protein VEB42_13765, partial [Chitinophagaceae bacterium]|nr:hypothetical protein [Chitinophagaceae bacterium]
MIMREYFSFTKKERVAVIVLVMVILAAYFLPYFFKPGFKPPSVKEVAEFKALEKELPQSKVEASLEQPKKLFYFDPNTLPAEGWKQLGLRERTIGTIIKFVSKGGRFHEPGDLKKIYGLHADEYERLERYVRIVKKAPTGSPLQIVYEKKPPRTRTILDI